MTKSNVASVVGFVFCRGQVLLVRKTRPFGQASRLAGVGGKVEIEEKSIDAMVRVCREKTGLRTVDLHWTWNASILALDGEACFYSYTLPDAYVIPELRSSDPAETLEWHPCLNLPEDVLPSLRWLVPFCRDNLAVGPIAARYNKKMTHVIGDSTQAVSVGRRYFVTTKTSGPVIGAVSSATNDGVTLTGLVYPGDAAPDQDASLIIADGNLEVFVDVGKMEERHLLLIADRMFQDGVRSARKE